MTGARRGEVWLVNLGVPVGREGGYVRPAVVVSSDTLNSGPGAVAIVVPMGTRPRGLPLHVEIRPGESGLDEISYARCEDVRSVATERLGHRLGTVPPDTMHRIGMTLRLLLEL